MRSSTFRNERKEGFDSYIALDGEEAIEVFEEEGAKIVVLDIMLPGMDGFAVCKKIRENSNAPIIIVSAKGAKEDKLNGILLGADDYIEKPYDVEILIAKIQGIMKRRYGSDKIKEGDICLDKISHKLFVRDEEKTLSVKEYELLLYLLENKGQTIKKDKLFKKVWGFDSESEMQTLTVHINWLREKIEIDPKEPKHIETVWGVGYRFN